MKKVATFWVFLLMVPLLVFGAERVNLVPSSEDVTVTIIESNDQHTVLRFDVAGFSRETVMINGQEYFEIQTGKESVLLNAGEPALPRFCRSIIIPDNAKMEIQVLSSNYRDFPQTPIIPSKGSLPRTINPADVPYEFGPVYQANQWYPEKLASIREPYILRDWRGTVVELNAFRYHTGRELLRVYTSVTVEIKSVGPGLTNVMDRSEPPTHVTPDFNLLYGRHFVNYGMSETRYTPVLETGEMLVITYDSFRSAVQPFVDWKIQKGIPVTIVDVSTIPNNSSSIDTYIDDFYTASGGNLCWVLLVGDATEVATPTASGGASDPTYAKTAGGDNYPDIFVGRFSAQSVGDVETQVERTIEYERDASSSSRWYDDGTGIGSDEGPGGHNGEYDYVHLDYIRTDLLNFTYAHVDQIYDPGASASQVTTAVNGGRSFINYTGHGSTTAWSTTGFSNTNVNALTNNNMLPFIISVACVNGDFPSYTCFGEAWLRATNGGEPTGAVAAYMSSINQDWAPPMDAQDESTDLLCAETMLTFGGICYNGSCKMMDLNGTSGVNMYNTWHIFGDPSVLLRTATVTAMSVSHDGVINYGIESFPVTVSGLEGALCALSYNGALLGAEYTDATGLATISVDGGSLPIGENIQLTVTAFNKETYIADVLVISGGPDEYPPNIAFTPFNDTMDETGPYVMDATITDYSGVESATFYHGFNGVDFTSQAMTYGGSDIWSASFGGYPAGTTIYYFVSAMDSSENHNMDSSDVYSFSVYGVIFSDDMESGQGDWTHSELDVGWADQWHLSTETNHSASHAWKFGDTGTGTYASHAYGGLVSPSISIGGEATLTFWHRIEAEVSGYYPDSAYDAGVVDISVDEGAWTQVTTLNPNYANVTRCTAGGSSPYTGPFDCATACYSDNFDWTEASVELDAYAGSSVQFRFRFGSDDGGGLEGWYMDDFMIIGMPSAAPVPVSDLCVQVVGTDLVLSWTSTGASQYNAYSDTDPNGAFATPRGSTSDTSLTIPLSVLTGEKYFFIVKASN